MPTPPPGYKNLRNTWEGVNRQLEEKAAALEAAETARTLAESARITAEAEKTVAEASLTAVITPPTLQLLGSDVSSGEVAFGNILTETDSVVYASWSDGSATEIEPRTYPVSYSGDAGAFLVNGAAPESGWFFLPFAPSVHQPGAYPGIPLRVTALASDLASPKSGTLTIWQKITVATNLGDTPLATLDLSKSYVL